MNLSAKLPRLRVFVLGTVSLCMVSTSYALPRDNQGATALTQETVGVAADSATERTLLEPHGKEIGLRLRSGADSNQLVIGSNLEGVEYKVNRLSGPDRLVIDLLGRPMSQSKVLDTTGAAYISHVRIGAHPDKSRIVLDLKGKNLTHSIETKDGNIVLTLASSDAAAQQASAASSESTESVAAAEQAATDERAHIAALHMETNDGSNMLVANLSAARPYTFARTAPSEYLLTVHDAQLDAEAAMTLISPQGSGAIRTVRPLTRGDDVLVRIFSVPGHTLVARADGAQVIVSNAGLAAEEPRAQLAPETTKETATSDAKPEVKSDATGTSATAKDAAAAPATTDADVEKDVSSLLDETPKYTGRLISLDLQDTDIDNALRIIAEVSNLNIIASEDVTGKVTLRLIDVPWDQALDVILKTNGLDKVQEGNVIRIAPVEKLRQEREALRQARQAEDALEALGVRYIRVSYSKAADLKPLVESVLTERGTVTYDERTNQLIVKDIKSGIKNVSELVSKVDLRTPQVLLETQIVEAQRSLARTLGAETGFNFVQSPANGHATGYNFPNAVTVGGVSGGSAKNTFASFPAGAGSAAVNFLFGSADGTKNLDVILSGLEREGRVRIVSRPSVATTNNKQATIKSVEKIRVKTPSGGLSVATGQGASASGNSAVATEAIEIGITLEVTPQASPDYYVLLDINAKSSTFGSHTVDGIPSEVERSATSTVLVSSGQTFAMGGIYKITDQDTVEGVPFFKDVPVLGHFFRSAGVDNSDEELLFFITPRIIEGSFDDATMKSAS